MIRLKLLGDAGLSASDGSPIGLPTRKDLALLAYLGLSRRPVERSRVLDLLWGDRGEEQARKSLRQSLVALRKVLNREIEIVPVARSQSLSLDRDGLWIDAVEFERCVLAGDNAGAAAIYGGPFLGDFRAPTKVFEDWLAVERTRLADLATTTFSDIARAGLQKADWAIAEAASRRAIEINPLNESAHRLQIRALDGSGRRNDALVHYDDLKSLLQDQLDVRPDPKTTALVRSLRQPARTSEPAASARAPKEAPRPGLAVLPLRFVEEGHEDQVLADGLTEELIASLAACRWFFVTSAMQSKALRDRAVEPWQLHADLGVRYVLAGVLKRSGNGLTIRLDLSDPVSGQHLWSERLKCDLHEVFEAQDELARTIAKAIEPELIRAEDEVTLRNPLQDFSRWQRLARARLLVERCDVQGLTEGHALAKDLAREFPDCAYAQATLGWASFLTFALAGILSDSLERSQEALEQGLAASRAATLIDPQYYFAHAALGTCHARLGDYDAGIPALRRSTDLNPSFAAVYNQLTSALTRAGRPNEALAFVEPLDRISPDTPERGFYHCVRTLTHFCLGDDGTAVENAEASLRAHPGWLTSELLLTAAARRHGDHERSRMAAERLIGSRGRMTRTQLFNIFPLRREADFEGMAQQLTDAGVLGA